MASNLHLEDYKRYGRQMILDGIGLPGQLKLQQATVAVVGAGGLGCPALQYLAAAGIGRIGIIDHDVVELSNLQRQTLHTESKLGTPKAESAASVLKEFCRDAFSVLLFTSLRCLTSQHLQGQLASLRGRDRGSPRSHERARAPKPV